MNMFEFVAKNIHMLEALQLSPDGEGILLPASEFDFGHVDLQFSEDSSSKLCFYVDIGSFRIITELFSDDLASNAQYLKRISDTNIREGVIMMMEGAMQEDSLAEVENAQAMVDEAKETLKTATDKDQSIKDALVILKKDWGIS